MTLKDHYPDAYNKWSGSPAGRTPDFSRCCVKVRDGSSRWPHYYQCSRKNGHGPDGAYCKQHVPDVVAKRDEERRERELARYRKQQMEWAGPRWFNVLKQIADGHNDPRSLAKEAIKGYE